MQGRKGSRRWLVWLGWMAVVGAIFLVITLTEAQRGYGGSGYGFRLDLSLPRWDGKTSRGSTPRQAYPVRRITSDPSNDIHPAWSPDGSTIAFVSNRIGGSDGYDLFAINPDGTSERLLAQFTVTDPWGGRFAEPSWLTTSNDLLVMDHKYFHEIMRFSLSQAIQDGALPVRRDVWDGDSPYFRRLLFVPGGQGTSSPITFNGSQIAWAAHIDNWAYVPPEQRRYQVRIYYGALDTFIGDTDEVGTILFQTDPGGYIEGKAIAFSPDGKELVISACVSGWTKGKKRDLYIVNLTSKQIRRITTTGEQGYDNTGVTWSSKNVIAFASSGGSNYDLYTIRPDGTGLTRLTDTPWNEIDPSWSPDGRSIAFASDKEGNYDLYIMELQISNQPPSVPVLLSPEDGATVSPTPTFKMKSIDPDGDQVKFEIQVVKGGETKPLTFTTAFVDSGSEASFTVPTDQSLLEGQWSWKARAIDSKGAASDWSKPQTFTVSAYDLSVSMVELARYNDPAKISAKAANWITIHAIIDNPAGKAINSCTVRFVAIKPDGTEMGVDKDETLRNLQTFPIHVYKEWQLPSRVMEGWKVRVEIVSCDPPDANPSNNSKTVGPFNFYYVSDGANNAPWNQEVDSYSFANRDMSWEDIIDMTDDIVTSLFNIAPPTEKLQIFTRAGEGENRGRGPILLASSAIVAYAGWVLSSYVTTLKGHCYGMASTSILYKQSNDFKPKSVRHMTTHEMQWENYDVRFNIKAFHKSQLASILAHPEWKSKMNATTEMEYLRKKIRDENKPAMVLVWRVQSQGGEEKLEVGHAVTAVSVLEYPEDKIAQIHVYDNSFPGPLYTARLDLQNNKFSYIWPGDTVFFNKLRATYPVTWTLSTAVRDVVNRATDWLLNEIEKKAQNFRTFIIRLFRGGGKQAQVIEPLFTDSQGRKVGYVAGTVVSEIPNAQVDKIWDAILIRVPIELSGKLDVKALSETEVSIGFIIGQSVSKLGSRQEGSTGLTIIEFEPVKLDTNGTVSSEVKPEQVSQLKVDRDGDGQFEETTSPTTTVEQVYEIVQVELPSGLSLISFPVQPTNPDPAVVLGQSPENIKLAKLDPLSGQYHFYAPGTSDALVGTLMAGEGYWVRLPKRYAVSLSCIKVTAGEVPIKLRRGWNSIGVPVLKATNWDLGAIKVRRNGEVKTLQQAQQAGWIEDYAWGWEQDVNDPFKGKYVLVYDTSIIPGVKGQLEPWKGYWVYAHQDCELILPPPSQSKGRGTRDAGRVAKGNGWTVKLVAKVDDEGGEAILGVSQGSRGLSIGLPPEPPEGSSNVQVLVLNNGAPLAVDVRNNAARQQVWDVVVKFGTRDGRRGAGTRKEVTLTWDGVGYAPKDVSLTLVDLATGTRRYMRTQTEYRFVPNEGETERRFKVIAELGNMRPLQIVGLKAIPMRGRGISIQFSLTKPAQTQVEVMTLTGRKVAVLESGRSRLSGQQQVIWQGRSNNGEVLPMGVYLIRVIAQDEEGRQVQGTTIARLR